MKEILCSTGAIIGRPNNRNHKLLSKYAGELDCDGFEFMVYDTWYENIDMVASDIMKLALNIPVVHCEKGIGELISKNEEENLKEALKLFEINCQVASDIKARKVVIHLWDGIPSDQKIQNNIKAYKLLKDIAGKYGISLMVENVVCNKADPMLHFCELYNEYPDISFTFDTKMAAFHNQLFTVFEEEWSWLWKENHIKHLHINDYNGGFLDWQNLKTLHIGDGKIDFDEFFRYLQLTGYAGDFTIEATSFNKTGEVDIDKLNKSMQLIRNYIRCYTI